MQVDYTEIQEIVREEMKSLSAPGRTESKQLILCTKSIEALRKH